MKVPTSAILIPAFVLLVLAVAMYGGWYQTEAVVPGRDYVSWAANDYGVEDWVREARKRFDDPFVLAVHGNGGRERRWTGVADAQHPDPDIQTVAALLQDVKPGRPIVLLACNPNRLRLPLRGVYYYPHGNVNWLPYDRWRGQDRGTAAGSIWQFVEGG